MIPIIEFEEIIKWLRRVNTQLNIPTLGRRSYILVRSITINNIEQIEITGANNVVFHADYIFWNLLTQRMSELGEDERGMGSRYVEPFFNGAPNIRFRPSIPAICRFYSEFNQQILMEV